MIFLSIRLMDTKAPTPPPSSNSRFLRGRRPVAARRQAWAFREAGGSRPTCRGHPVAAMNARPTESRVASTGFAFIGGHGSARDQRRRRRTRMPRQSAIARDLRPIGACVANRDPPPPPPPPHRQAWTPDRDEHRGRQTCRRVSRRSRRMCGRPDRGLRARASPSLGSRPCTPGEAVPPAEARP